MFGQARPFTILASAFVMAAISSPAAADAPTAPSDATAQVNQAQDQLKSAQSTASQADTAVTNAQHDLQAVQAQVTALHQQEQALDGAITRDTATVKQVQAQESQDSKDLGGYLLHSYERGFDQPFLYVISAGNVSDMIDRQVNVQRLQRAEQDLVIRIRAHRQQAEKIVADEHTQRDQLTAAHQQAAALSVLVGQQEQRLAAADAVAHQSVAQAQLSLAQAKDALAAQIRVQAAAAALQAAKSHGTIYPPVTGATFTVDTDLTQPSGLSADGINKFLSGTALAGLGDAYVRAEHDHHVSARYLVAHSIEESAWGVSQIAHDKHNLFGYGANDANPYKDAVTFPSFTTCIDFVSQMVAQNYLASAGKYFHGPTLRGMNIDYASDPNWASNIAAIADLIP